MPGVCRRAERPRFAARIVIRFLVDNQLPAALARWIKNQGHEADHVLDLGLAESADKLIRQRASALGAVIVTKDEDFAQLTILGPEQVIPTAT
jgi:predicted nuclease of predicted toxin-antitoxin system